jgi:hypothetical protein
MIDLTTIQTFQIPLDVDVLQNKVVTLTEANKNLKRILLLLVISAAAYGVYQIYKNYNKDESKESKDI